MRGAIARAPDVATRAVVGAVASRARGARDTSGATRVGVARVTRGANGVVGRAGRAGRARAMTRASSGALDVFLRDARDAFARDASAVAVCLGNEACDLDSVACAVAWAYAESMTTGRTVVPVVQCERKDLALRPDVVLALRSVGVSVESLTCAEDAAAADGRTPSETRLVDHNAHTGRVIPASWGERVVRIIDHHEDIGAHAEAAERTIELVGSCSSLVYRDVVAPSGREDVARNVARLLLGAIILDTRMLDASTTRASPVDFAAAEVLQKLLGWDEGAVREEYEALSRARHDQSSFTCAQLLAKDYKQWKMGRFEVGIASFGVRVQDLIARQDAASIDAECEEFIVKHGIDALIMMTSFENPDEGGAFARQIAATTPRSSDDLDTADIMAKIGAATDVTPLTLPHAPRALQSAHAQLDVKASRKKIAPILFDVFADL